MDPVADTITGEIRNITERRVGSPLLVAAATDDTSITVADSDEFDWDGGSLEIGPTTDTDATDTETHAYTVPLDSDGENDGTLDLGTALDADYDEGTDVFVYPARYERIAHVLSPNQEDPLEILVPFALWDRLPLGARDPDDNVTPPEQVIAEIVDGNPYLREVTNAVPVIDGGFIDPDTTPPPADNPDGSPPANSPDATIVGGIAELFVKWTAISNGNEVTYKVHISTSTGFTPDDLTTLAATTKGQLAVIRQMPDGTPLAYWTNPNAPDPADRVPQTYYVQIVAEDVDGAASPGAEASGQLVQVSGPDIAANSVIAEHIVAGNVLAESLESTLVLATDIKTALTGERVEILGNGDTDGIFLYDSNNDNVVSMRSIDGAVTVHGTLWADALTVFDYMTIAGTHNVVDGGAVVTVQSAQADPTSAPTVNLAYETIDLVTYGYLGDFTNSRGVWYDASGNGSQATFLTALPYAPGGGFIINENKVADGDLVGAALVGDGLITFDHNDALIGDEDEGGGPAAHDEVVIGVSGICQIGSSNYIGLITNYEFYIVKVSASTFAYQDQHTITLSADQKYATLGTDGTYVCVAGANGTGGTADIEIKRFNASTLAFNDTLTTSGLTFPGSTTYFEGLVAGVESAWWISHNKNNYHGPNMFLTSGRANQDEHGFIAKPGGICHDGTQFWSRAGQTMYKHTAMDWTGTGKMVHAYEWTDGTHFTLPSPQAIFSVRPDTSLAHRAYRRARFKITMPPFPSGVTGYRLFEARNTSVPVANSSLHRQTTSAYIDSETNRTTYMKNEDTGGAAPATSNDFPGDVGTIQSQSATTAAAGGWLLDGNQSKGIIPAGTVLPYAGSSAPTGWHVCDGSAQVRADYPDLFAAIGTTYGAGNGTTTFNIPDLVGRVPVGVDGTGTRVPEPNDFAETGGEATHQLTTAELPAHTHGMKYLNDVQTGSSNRRVTGAAGQDGTSQTDSTGSDTAHQNMPPYIMMNYIIRLA